MHLNLKIQYPQLFYVFIWILFLSFSNSFSAFSQEDIKKDIQHKIKKLKETPNFKKDTTYINLLHDLNWEYIHYNLDSLLFTSKEIITLSKAIKYTKGDAKGHFFLGIYYSDKGDQDQAISYFSKALSKGEEINDTLIIIQSKIELAREYEYKEENAKSLREYLSAIEIAEKSKNDSWLSNLYLNVSALYGNQKDHEQSILFLKKAKELNKKTGEEERTGIILSNLAIAYTSMGDLTSANLNINEAISIFEKLKTDDWLAYIYQIKANIYLEKNQFNEALIWLKKSEVIHENIDSIREKKQLNLLLSKAYFELKDYEVSEAYALKALEISKELNVLTNRDKIFEILYKIKKTNNDPVAALTYLEEFKAISDTINKNDNIKELRILKSTLVAEHEKDQYILANEKKDAKQLSYTYISALVIFAFLIIIIILKKNNRTQNILNQKLIENTLALKKNEAHLNDANNTKNKLFSIIAHDLKGPINSFKSLFDLFNKSELTTTEFMEFMPQIGENIDSIAFTLNNLLTWGQTQMNGLVTKPNYTTIKTLVDESIKLLSKQTEAKSITIANNINQKVITWSDKDQIDIVIRNLISNAVKFTREHGAITIDASEKSNFWEIVVRDNGVGMSEDVLNNIFNDEETSTTYGTQNEKGTGLGLRVCKEMVQNNGGTIWVESTLNHGSSFYFTVPKTKKL
ncbi:ATP-binding protein [Algibacter sp. L4_22]|uniref:tetratricopeptide repeat-containing sensor histidine kinase n=1 Tax=Algibacter sp. L4_22 TaxID=2942477 RepID=UPI00201B8DCA|nr:ATP-binding protein [Algibacter sp. L4_22]MCL5127683.1 ATP-binding protein [Algibacter sp. L4_22]